MARDDEVANDVVVRRRKLLLFSFVLDIGVVCWLAALHHPMWRWSLVAWGLVIGIVWLAMLETTLLLLQRMVDVAPVRREIVRKRQPVYIGACLTFGLVFGLASAIANQVGVVIAGAVLVFLSQMLGVVRGPRVVRRQRQAGT